MVEIVNYILMIYVFIILNAINNAVNIYRNYINHFKSSLLTALRKRNSWKYSNITLVTEGLSYCVIHLCDIHEATRNFQSANRWAYAAIHRLITSHLQGFKASFHTSSNYIFPVGFEAEMRVFLVCYFKQKLVHIYVYETI
jgi:hypothetical protein